MISRREVLIAIATSMSGAMLGSPTLRAMEGESPTNEPSRAIFNEAQSQMVSVLAEMIIPTTDTPGAIAAGTPAFIEMMAADWYTDTERKIFFEGLAALDAYCQATYDKSFLAASEEQQIAALQAAESQAAEYKSAAPEGFAAAMMKYVDEHSPFFTKIKELTVIGYYSSEVGATQEMAYNPMPMSYQGDYDFVTVGRHWSS